jgi:hypothetical protein
VPWMQAWRGAAALGAEWVPAGAAAV